MTTQTAVATETNVPAILSSTTTFSALARLRAYVATEGDDLIASCSWLGGPKWTLMAEALTMAALRSEPLGGWQRHVLESLHRLLSFKRVEDIDDSEAGAFVCIDMADPRIRSCGRHADALGGVLAQLRTQDLATHHAREELPEHASAA